MNVRLFAAIGAIAVTMAACGQAGQDTSGRVSIRQACGADMAKFCADVDRSGRRACMEQHEADLSAGCKAAIAARRAAMGGPGSAAPAPVASAAAASSASSAP